MIVSSNALISCDTFLNPKVLLSCVPYVCIEAAQHHLRVCFNLTLGSEILFIY